MDEKTKAIRQLDEARATIRAQAEKIERIQQKGVVIMEMYEAELARIKSAEGCDLEGALAIMYPPVQLRGRPTIEELEALLQQPEGPRVHINPDGSIGAVNSEERVRIISAALAVGCAPLRAKIEKMEAILREIAEDTHDRVSPGLKRTALSALKAADAKRREQEKE